MLDRLGRTAARRHWRFIGVWLAGAAVIVALAIASGGHTFDDFTIPDTESQSALDLLESRFPAQSGASATVVLHATTGTLEGQADAIEQAVANLRALPQKP